MGRPLASSSALCLPLCTASKKSKDVVSGVEPGTAANEPPLGAVGVQPPFAAGDSANPFARRCHLPHSPHHAVECTADAS
eukprot:7428427-Lingulodinium_polyedra.AAC.1